MFNVKIKTLMIAAVSALFLSGCTESTILWPEGAEQPDFNVYENIELDDEQLLSDWQDICLEESDYPMAAALDFERHEKDGYVDITLAVKDGTSREDAAAFAVEAIQAFNDQVAVQDFSYDSAEDGSFGSYFAHLEIRLKIYEESAYKAEGEPMYEASVPAGSYSTFEE